MLPMLPTRPILLGGIIGPLIWTGLLYEILGFVNPLLDQRINWWWFAVSQVGFGIAAGVVVARQTKVLTTENLPLAMRAGLVYALLLLGGGLLALIGCRMPGKPTPGDEVKRPDDVLDAVVLYKQ